MIRIVNGQIQRLRLHRNPFEQGIKVTDLKHLAELYEHMMNGVRPCFLRCRSMRAVESTVFPSMTHRTGI